MRTPWTEAGRRAADWVLSSNALGDPSASHAVSLIAAAEQEARIAAATAERQRLRAELMDFINERLFGEAEVPG